jgi:hypothetical protein
MFAILLGLSFYWGILCLLRRWLFWTFILDSLFILFVAVLFALSSFFASQPSMREFPIFFVVGSFFPALKLGASLLISLALVVELAVLLFRKKAYSFKTFFGSKRLSRIGLAAILAGVSAFVWQMVQTKASGVSEKERNAYESVLKACDQARGASRLVAQETAWNVGLRAGYGLLGVHLTSPSDDLLKSCFDDFQRRPDYGGIAEFRKENDLISDKDGPNWTLMQFRLATISLSALEVAPQDSLDAIYTRIKADAIEAYLLADGLRKIPLRLKGSSSGGEWDTLRIEGRIYPKYATIEWNVEYSELLKDKPKSLELILAKTNPELKSAVPIAFIGESQFSPITD